MDGAPDHSRQQNLLRALGHLNDQLTAAGAEPLVLDNAAGELDIETLRALVDTSARWLIHLVNEANG